MNIATLKTHGQYFKKQTNEPLDSAGGNVKWYAAVKEKSMVVPKRILQ